MKYEFYLKTRLYYIRKTGKQVYLDKDSKEPDIDDSVSLEKYAHAELDGFDSSNTSICYYYKDGCLMFDIESTRPLDTIVHYEGEDMPLKDAITKYIAGQISDGWGENGIGYYNDEVLWGDYLGIKELEENY